MGRTLEETGIEKRKAEESAIDVSVNRAASEEQE